MLLQNIEYFRVVAETGNMTKAASVLHVSQPSLSIAIGKLEEELGVKLFDRVGKRIYLNPMGTRFLQWTTEFMVNLDAVREEIAEMGGVYSTQITVLTTADHLLIPLLYEFAAEHPEYKIQQYLCSPERVLEMLTNGEADFAVTTEDISSEYIIWNKVAHQRRAILLSEHNSLARETQITTETLKDMDFVIYSSSREGTEVIDWIKDTFGFQPRVRFVTNEFESMVHLVSHNMGIALLDEHDAQIVASNTGMHVFYSTLRDEKTMQHIGIAYQKNHFLSTAALSFKDYIEKQLKQHRKSM